MWSMSTSLTPPRTNKIVLPVYGSAKVPDITRHEPDITLAVRSRISMSSRVSQPLWSTSNHAAPNCARAYPVLGARPFTGRASTAASATPLAPVAATVGAGIVEDRMGDGDVEADPLDACALAEEPPGATLEPITSAGLATPAAQAERTSPGSVTTTRSSRIRAIAESPLLITHDAQATIVTPRRSQERDRDRVAHLPANSGRRSHPNAAPRC
ncbi:unannotated protein [freshwater metagenome]|uniref:Unannotated protein n=1 Tax=freshwater metagenome TaxID=449393 RepID=A0A6J7I2A4_9ZZZZ